MSAVRRAQRVLARQHAAAHLNAYVSLPSEAGLIDRVRAQSSDLPPTNASENNSNNPNSNTSDRSLTGMLISVKDNICTATLPTTAGSRILAGFTSPFDATVVELLQNAGAIVNGKTNLDEFGMGSHSTHSPVGPVTQLLEAGKSPDTTDVGSFSVGGSSGGSALAVSLGLADASLGTDTGGSVRLPAAYTSVIGFKPSYGLLSRWGVIAYANSLDTVGILARDVNTVQRLFDVLNQHDNRDPTSFRSNTRARLVQAAEQARAKLGPSPASLVVGVPAEYIIQELSNPVRTGWTDALDYLRQRGAEIRPVSLPSTRLALAAYYVLAPAEASSNLAKYDGVRYGVRAGSKDSTNPASQTNTTDLPYDGDHENPLFTRTRGLGLGAEVQRRILLGTYSLTASAIDNYFVQAQRVRRLVQRDFDAVFRTPNALLAEGTDSAAPGAAGCDVLITPTAPTLPPRLDDVMGQRSVDGYMNDVFTVPASLAGLPAISVPAGWWKARNGKSREEKENINDGLHDHFNNGSIHDKIGIQVIGQIGDDRTVLHVARLLEGSA